MSNTLSNALRPTTSENKRTSTYSNVQETVVKESKDTVLSYSKLDSACFELLPLNSSQEDQLMSEMQNDSNFDALLSTLDIPLCTEPTCQPLSELPRNNYNINMQSTFTGLSVIHTCGTININYGALPK